MEELGSKSITEEGSFVVNYTSFDGSTKLKLTSKGHNLEDWREATLEESVHLKDKIRKKFWLYEVLKFFDY